LTWHGRYPAFSPHEFRRRGSPVAAARAARTPRRQAPRMQDENGDACHWLASIDIFTGTSHRRFAVRSCRALAIVVGLTGRAPALVIAVKENRRTWAKRNTMRRRRRRAAFLLLYPRVYRIFGTRTGMRQTNLHQQVRVKVRTSGPSQEFPLGVLRRVRGLGDPFGYLTATLARFGRTVGHISQKPASDAVQDENRCRAVHLAAVCLSLYRRCET
jgi:hypothetical protein